MTTLKALDFQTLGTQPLRVLIVEKRLSPRKQYVDWFRRRLARGEVEGLAPGGSLAALKRQDFDLVLIGRIGPRRLLTELVQSAFERNPQAIVAVERPRPTGSRSGPMLSFSFDETRWIK